MQKNLELNSINPVKIVIIFWVQKIMIVPMLFVKIHLWGTAITGRRSVLLRGGTIPPTTGKTGKGGFAILKNINRLGVPLPQIVVKMLNQIGDGE